MFFGKCLHFFGVVITHRQWFFDHYVYPFWGAGFHHGEMVFDVSKSGNRFGLNGRDHFFHGIIYQIHRKPMLFRQAFCQIPVRFHDAHHFYVTQIFTAQDPANMAMGEPHHTQFQGFFLGMGTPYGNQDQTKGKGKFFGHRSMINYMNIDGLNALLARHFIGFCQPLDKFFVNLFLTGHLYSMGAHGSKRSGMLQPIGQRLSRQF